MLYVFKTGDSYLTYTTKVNEIDEMIAFTRERFELDEDEGTVVKLKGLYAFLSLYEIEEEYFVLDYLFSSTLKNLLKIEKLDHEGWYSYKRIHLYHIDENGNYKLIA